MISTFRTQRSRAEVRGMAVRLSPTFPIGLLIGRWESQESGHRLRQQIVGQSDSELLFEEGDYTVTGSGS
jgi:hypothetical protein